MDLHIKGKTIKGLNENIGANLQDLELGKESVSMIPKDDP